MIESFFGMLRAELFRLLGFENVDQLEQAVHSYIYYYKTSVSSLGYKGSAR